MEGDYEDQLREHLDKQDWEAAGLLTHTLKGLAGTIGATALEKQINWACNVVTSDSSIMTKS